MPSRERLPALNAPVGTIWTAPDGTALPEDHALEVVRHGDLTVRGRLVTASNASLYAVVTLDDVQAACIYKPVAGERPLWDFPDGTLAGREVAAHRVSAAAGFDVVPPTVLRDGPFGPGSVQWWVGAGADEPVAHRGAGLVDVATPADVPPDWVPVVDGYDEHGDPVVLAHAPDPRLATVAVLDLLVNNADRKAGHLIETGGRVIGVDHGLTFHRDDKLRTVLWGFAGHPVASDDLARVRTLRAHLDDGSCARHLDGLLTDAEVAALSDRVDAMLASPVMPSPDPGRSMIPWPPF